MSSFVQLHKPAIIGGDFESIALHGMSRSRSRVQGVMQLERIGPFVPPISFPGIHDVVVTDDFKKDLESAGLAGIQFRQVNLARVVEVNLGRKAIMSDGIPDELKRGCPEDLITKRKHSDRIAKLIGPVWELSPVKLGKIDRTDRDRPRLTGIRAASVDVFTCDDEWFHPVLLNDRGREWFEREARIFVSFLPLQVDLADL